MNKKTKLFVIGSSSLAFLFVWLISFSLIVYAINGGSDKKTIDKNTPTVVRDAAPVKTTPVVEEKIETKTEPIPFTSTNENDASLAQGQTKTKQAGVNGTKEVKAKVTYVDGKETKREPMPEVVTLQPVPQIVSVGTYVAPAPTPAPTPAPAANPSGPPSGATAKCNDGTYSYSANHSGTCSHHGGVAEWYR